MLVYICMYLYAYVWRPRSTPCVFKAQGLFTLYFEEWFFHRIWSSLIWLGCSANGLQGSDCLYGNSMLELQEHTLMSGFHIGVGNLTQILRLA